MVSFEIFVKRFGKIEPFVKKESAKILKAKGAEIVGMVQEQHHRGVNADGKIMQKGYSTSYGKKRKKKGLQIGFVDQHFSGKYHDKQKVFIVKDGIDIKSGLDYEKYLRTNFPKSVGLTPKNAEKAAIALTNLLAPKMKKYLVG